MYILKAARRVILLLAASMLISPPMPVFEPVAPSASEGKQVISSEILIIEGVPVAFTLYNSGGVILDAARILEDG